MFVTSSAGLGGQSLAVVEQCFKYCCCIFSIMPEWESSTRV